MRRIWRSLAGQLLALLLAALALAHLLAVGVMSWGEGARVRVHPLAERAIAAQVMTAYRLALAGADVSMLRALDSPESRFRRTWEAPPAVVREPRQQLAVIDAIRQGLNLPEKIPLYAALHEIRPDEASAAPDAPAGWIQTLNAGQAWALEVALELPDGQWLLGQHWPTMMHPHWDRVLRFSFAVSALAIMLIAIAFGRSVMRPLKALARAARRISRGESLPPLPLQGPSSVREITRAFNDMQERLHRYIADRTRMIAAIGHDLRTPLTSLRIRVELIEDAAVREAMRSTLDDMALMAEETLRFARDDAAQEPTASVDLTALIDEVVAHQRVLGRDVAWQAPGAIAWRCRPVQIKRVLGNLLENAVRYGRADVQLAVEAAQVRITVQDDGPGIPSDQIERVFEPFARLDAARNLEHGSAGLGLAIARSFARAHGGDVHLYNRAAGGLCAVVTLPG